MCPLEGKVAVVAGATRGAGRGIASMLGEAGATVYCTGRSVRGEPATPGRSETIDQTADTVPLTSALRDETLRLTQASAPSAAIRIVRLGMFLFIIVSLWS